MYVPATRFLPLALSILWPQSLTWNLHNTGQFCSNTWNRFISNRYLISSGIFVYCFDKQTFATLLVFTSHIHTAMSPSPNFSCLYCYNVVISLHQSSLQNVYHFVILPFYFVLLVCYARLAACVFVQLLHNLKQHMVQQVSL